MRPAAAAALRGMPEAGHAPRAFGHARRAFQRDRQTDKAGQIYDKKWYVFVLPYLVNPRCEGSFEVFSNMLLGGDSCICPTRT